MARPISAYSRRLRTSWHEAGPHNQAESRTRQSPPCAGGEEGALRSDLFDLDFIEYTPTNTAFKPMVRERAFDVCEMAIVTYLMAKAHGKPLVLLPATMLGRFQHSYALYNPAHGTLEIGRASCRERV